MMVEVAGTYSRDSTEALGLITCHDNDEFFQIYGRLVTPLGVKQIPQSFPPN